MHSIDDCLWNEGDIKNLFVRCSPFVEISESVIHIHTLLRKLDKL